MRVTGGATDVTTYFVLRDAADGTATTGATITNIDLQYVRNGSAPSAKVDATALAAADSAHADNKAIEVDGTDAPGLYRVDWPDAAFAAGVKNVILTVKLASSFTEHMEVEIDAPVNVTKVGGQTASATGAVDFDDVAAILLDTDELQGDWANGGRLDLILDARASQTTADAIETDTQDIQSRIPAALTGDGLIQADVIRISGDDAAANNLEAMYDGDGYVADTAPASRAQVSGIQASSGAFIASTIADNNITGTDPLNGVSKVAGATSGNVTDLTAQDGVGLEVPHSVNEIDVVFQINVPSNAVPISVLFDGYINGANDSCPIKVYDHDGTAWVTVATITGQSGSTNNEIIAPLGESRYVSSAGVVYIRFDSTGTSQSLFLDRLSVEYANQTVGYSNGAIWVNTNASNTNTTDFVDGTADNPVSSWAAALTLSSSLGLKKFQLVGGSAITLTANSDNYEIIGYGSTVALNGQSVAGAMFEGASISGNDDGSNASPVRFRNCSIGTCTLGAYRMNQCAMTGTITLAQATTYIMEQCLCACTGGASPVIDVGAAVGNTTVSIRHWSGSMEVRNMGQSGTDLFTMQGWGKLTINANCTGGTVNLHGHIVLDNNGSGQTINDNARIDQASILEAVTDDDTKLDGSSLNAVEAKVDDILTDTGTTLPATLGTPTDTDLATDIANVQTTADAVETDTQDLQNQVGTAGDGLTSLPEVDADVVKISGSATAADKLEASALSVFVGAATSNGAGDGTTIVDTTLGARDNTWNERVLIITSGTLVGEATDITDYDQATKTLTVTALSGQVASGVTYVIL